MNNNNNFKYIEGQLNGAGLKVAIVAARFNEFVVGRLIEGACDYLVRHGAAAEDTTVIRVPGAYEIPFIAQKAARSKKYDAIICLGAVIRGGTPHFEYVAAEVSKGVAAVALESDIPVVFGVLTTDSIEQAIERAGTKAGNKGAEAAAAAVELVHVLKQL